MTTTPILAPPGVARSKSLKVVAIDADRCPPRRVATCDDGRRLPAKSRQRI